MFIDKIYVTKSVDKRTIFLNSQIFGIFFLNFLNHMIPIMAVTEIETSS